MKYYEEMKHLKLHHSVITLGKFDGVHLGHRAILNYIKEQKKTGLQSVVVTFSRHPSQVLYNSSLELIYTKEEKRKKLEEIGIDVLVSYPFTKEAASMNPEEFVRQVLVEQLGGKIIAVGTDFCFGHNRKGTIALLKKLSKIYHFEVVIFDKVKCHDTVVSSSVIREAIKEGKLKRANEMLGEPFSITERIVHGNEIGRTLGMPTTNMIPKKEKLLPPNGVYISGIHFQNKFYGGITNIGYKPTVGMESERGVETYIFDYSGNLYGEDLKVELYQFVRGEEKFPSLETLKKQMSQDMLAGKQYFLRQGM